MFNASRRLAHRLADPSKSQDPNTFAINSAGKRHLTPGPLASPDVVISHDNLPAVANSSASAMSATSSVKTP